MAGILIAGGGGFGLELYSYIAEDIAAGLMPGHHLAGVLNDGEDCEVTRKIPGVQFRGPLQDYRPESDEAVLIAVGTVAGRRKIAKIMRDCGARLFTYVHRSAWVAGSSNLGEGVVVCPNSLVNAGARVGDNVAINVFCSVGHGAQIGAHSVLSPYCSLSGDSVLGEGGFMGTRATLFPKTVLGSDCIVDAHSAVRQSEPDNKMISVRGQYLVLDNRLPRAGRSSV